MTAETLPGSQPHLEAVGVPWGLSVSPTWLVVLFLSGEQALEIHTACGQRVGFKVTDCCRKILCGVWQKINMVL